MSVQINALHGPLVYRDPSNKRNETNDIMIGVAKWEIPISVWYE